jgi:cation diffusion facilitator family transporter
VEKSVQATLAGIILNIILFAAKLIVGMLSGSLAIISDAFNSLTDILSSAGIFVAVRVSNKRADEDHPFGHHRAEPIAALIVAIFAGILGFEILRSAIAGFYTERTFSFGIAAVAVLLFTMAVKLFMYIYFTKIGTSLNRPAIKASGIDSRNDIFVSGIALIGVFGYSFGLPQLDSIAAILISFFIFYSGYRIGVENMDYLMGKCPPKEFVDSVKVTVRKVKGVKGINTVKAHYVGNYIHFEIHIEVDRDSTTNISHAIGKRVQRAVEKFREVDKAFIHVDPV